jgi:protein-S-isoprenylcysteine O-methyltransferase Ste14
MTSIFVSSLVLTLFFAAYAVVHSWLASAPVKAKARRQFGPAADRWYRLAYNLFAVLSLLPMFIMIALLPGQTLYLAPAPWRWLMLTGQLLAALAAAFSLWQTGIGHFLGLAQLMAERPAQPAALNLKGFYAWVRHPLYSFSILFLWLTPVMTTNAFITFLLFTLYFYFGSIYEEQRLVAEFGRTYEEYQRQVPRLFPLPWRHYVPQRQESA